MGITHADIITDSKSALMALEAYVTKSKLVKDCMNELEKAQNKIIINVHWTKAHVGHEGNEKADELAKLGTTKVGMGVEPIIPVSRSWTQGKINNFLHKTWKQRWESNNEARQTKIFFPEPNAKKAKKLLAQ
jgi:hypothetical protein